MLPCKFYLEGTCKFGERCRYEHINPAYNTGYGTSEDRPFGTSILKGAGSNTPLATRQEYGGQDYSHVVNQSFQQHNYQQKTSKYNVQEIMEVIIKDILQAEKGNQWQLSCYSPLKDLPNLPGLEDHSSEELRYECYKASQNGSIPLWQAIVQQLYANVMKTYNELKRKDSGYTIIDRWLREAEQKNSQSNVSATTPFESSLVSSPVFGSTNNAGSSVFGGSNASSSFLVSNSSHTSMFGSNEQTSGFEVNITSSFGGSNNFVSPGFGNTTNNSPLTNPFSSQTNNQAGSSFSFSLPQQQPSNVQTSPGSGFALGSNMGQPMSSFPPSIQPFSAGINSTVDNQEYSNEEEFTPEELEAFKADRFSFGSIPTKPPPRTFCNL